jgi:hypothetical protein
MAKCSKCGETSNPAKARFCSKCGNQMTATEGGLKFTPSKTLTKDQNDCLKHFVEELQFLITKYGIKSEPLTQEEAEKHSDDNSYNLWSTSGEWASGALVSGDKQTNYVGGFWLGQGDCDDCDDFYLSEAEISEEVYQGAYTEIRFVCHRCEGDTNLIEDCPNCDGEGELIFDLSWENGEVHYEGS